MALRNTHGDALAALGVDEPHEPEGTPRMRTANRLAVAAFFLVATSLLLPWWALQASQAGVDGELVDPVGLWGPNAEVAKPSMVWLTVGALGGALLLLFVRVAAASWRHEPATFRRDVAFAALLLLLACASTWLWPVEFPFWGTRAYTDNVTGDPTIVIGSPALGWWLVAVAALTALLGVMASTRSGSTQR